MRNIWTTLENGLRQKEMVFVSFTRIGSPPISRSPRRRSISNSRLRSPWMSASCRSTAPNMPGFSSFSSYFPCVSIHFSFIFHNFHLFSIVLGYRTAHCPPSLAPLWLFWLKVAPESDDLGRPCGVPAVAAAVSAPSDREKAPAPPWLMAYGACAVKPGRRSPRRAAFNVLFALSWEHLDSSG